MSTYGEGYEAESPEMTDDDGGAAADATAYDTATPAVEEVPVYEPPPAYEPPVMEEPPAPPIEEPVAPPAEDPVAEAPVADASAVEAPPAPPIDMTGVDTTTPPPAPPVDGSVSEAPPAPPAETAPPIDTETLVSAAPPIDAGPQTTVPEATAPAPPIDMTGVDTTTPPPAPLDELTDPASAPPPPPIDPAAESGQSVAPPLPETGLVDDQGLPWPTEPPRTLDSDDPTHTEFTAVAERSIIDPTMAPNPMTVDADADLALDVDGELALDGDADADSEADDGPVVSPFLDEQFDLAGDELAPSGQPIFVPGVTPPDELVVLVPEGNMLVVHPTLGAGIVNPTTGEVVLAEDTVWLNPALRTTGDGTVLIGLGQSLIWDPDVGLVVLENGVATPLEDLLDEHPELIPESFTVEHPIPEPPDEGHRPPIVIERPDPVVEVERTVVVRHEQGSSTITHTVPAPAPEPAPAVSPIDLSSPDLSVTDAVTELLNLDTDGLDSSSPEDIKALFTDRGLDADVVAGQSIDDLKTHLDDDKTIMVALDKDELFGGDDDDEDGSKGANAVMELIEIDEERGVVILEDADGDRIEVALDDFQDAWDDADTSLVVADSDGASGPAFGSIARTAGLVMVPVVVGGAAAVGAATVAKRRAAVRPMGQA